MDSVDELCGCHASLAEVISLEYANIPNAQTSEVFSEAQQALFRAAKGYDPSRGEFGPYAARAIRNSLNTLYAKQLKLARIFPVSLDEPPNWANLDAFESDAAAFSPEKRDSKQDVLGEVRRKETSSVIEEVLQCLSPRERIVVDGIRLGRSLREIGDALGVSKQAVHKVSTAALSKLHGKLLALGYDGIDSKGFLKSARLGSPG